MAWRTIWTSTGASHTGWGKGAPFAALDFAPPAEHSGCFEVKPDNYAVAMADGLVVRSEIDGLAHDLDIYWRFTHRLGQRCTVCRARLRASCRTFGLLRSEAG